MDRIDRRSGSGWRSGAGWRWVILACLLLGALPAGAAEEEPPPPDIRYVPLQPTVVANFAAEATGRLHFLRTDVSVRVDGADREKKVRNHAPLLRAELLLMIAERSLDDLATGDGREAMRAEMLTMFRELMEREEGEPMVEDVLFENFVVQR